jgi:hypothetical protein
LCTVATPTASPPYVYPKQIARNHTNNSIARSHHHDQRSLHRHPSPRDLDRDPVQRLVSISLINKQTMKFILTHSQLLHPSG